MADLFLAPTAEVPKPNPKAPEHPPAHGLCPGCGTPVLRCVRAGKVVIVERQCAPLYVVLWDSGTALPRAEQSGGYAEHQCWGDPGVEQQRKAENVNASQ